MIGWFTSVQTVCGRTSVTAQRDPLTCIELKKTRWTLLEKLAEFWGGELETKGLNGRIRSKDTIGKPDPFPPRDKEH